MQSPLEDIISDGSKNKKGVINFNQMKVISSKVEKQTPSVLMITSIPAGKSVALIAAELAAAIALQERKVLLVEGDFKKPQLHKWFHMEQTADTHQKPFTPVLPTFLPNLDVLLAKGSNENPIDIWLAPSFKQQVDSWQEAYDRVIFAAPSLYSGVEAELIADGCQEAVLVVQRKKDKLEEIKKAHAKLEMAGCKVIGLVYQQ
ncbi:tyrosine-protein kinase family protein [Halobacillus sp. H74]|uniref:tyrosine-protein kinase family protein n=1 Tax=Halobacillus sp. H74 TaxID=3457436 RepID=UPI003FCD75D5